MKANVRWGGITLFVVFSLLLGVISCTSEPSPTYLVYKTGKYVKLVDKAELCTSVIADGKEFITKEGMKGEIVVSELKDSNVSITFKEDVEDFSNAFVLCNELVSVPENLFSTCPKATSFNGTFYYCTSLQTIPANLFANNPKVTDFSGTFANTSITSIPKGLFSRNPEITSFFCTFAWCTSLQELSDDLFSNCPKVTTFAATFDSCTSLRTIPENLFAASPNVTDFSSTFRCCWGLKEIPSNLFAKNVAATRFFATFSGCQSLEAIPASLFDNNLNVTNFEFTFSDCISLTGESPYTMIGSKMVHLYDREKYPERFSTPTEYPSTFSGSTGLSDYTTMSYGWN